MQIFGRLDSNLPTTVSSEMTCDNSDHVGYSTSGHVTTTRMLAFMAYLLTLPNNLRLPPFEIGEAFVAAAAEVSVNSSRYIRP